MLSAVMSLMRRYHTDLLSQDLRLIRTRFYTDTLFPKAESVSGHTLAQIFTDGEGFFWITSLFGKTGFGMALRALVIQVGILNELHFDKAADQMVLHSNFQCEIR